LQAGFDSPPRFNAACRGRLKTVKMKNLVQRAQAASPTILAAAIFALLFMYALASHGQDSTGVKPKAKAQQCSALKGGTK